MKYRGKRSSWLLLNIIITIIITIIIDRGRQVGKVRQRRKVDQLVRDVKMVEETRHENPLKHGGKRSSWLLLNIIISIDHRQEGEARQVSSKEG